MVTYEPKERLKSMEKSVFFHKSKIIAKKKAHSEKLHVYLHQLMMKDNDLFN